MAKQKFIKRSRTGMKVVSQSCYIPCEVYRELDNYCARTGLTKTMVIVQALRAKLVDTLMRDDPRV